MIILVVVLNSFSSPRLPGFQLLRDTFAGKNLTEICRRETDYEKWSEFYRQKCRAAAELNLTTQTCQIKFTFDYMKTMQVNFIVATLSVAQ